MKSGVQKKRHSCQFTLKKIKETKPEFKNNKTALHLPRNITKKEK